MADRRRALFWWSQASSPALMWSPARVHQSDWRLWQPSPADAEGHVHVLGLCPDWLVSLTGCGLWSQRGSRFRGWLNANTVCAGLLGRWPVCPPLGPEKLNRAVLLWHSPLSGFPNGCGTLRISHIKKTGVPAVFVLSLAFEGT